MVKKNVKKIIVIVGCGNLGKRHFQSLLEANYSLEIHLIKPSKTSFKVSNELPKYS